MKTPREILFEQHQSATAKLDAIRAQAVAELSPKSAPETISWGEWLRSLRWHFAALGAAWAVVVILNLDFSSASSANLAVGQTPPPQQIWACLRERQLLYEEYSDEQPDVETVETPGLRSEIALERVEV